MKNDMSIQHRRNNSEKYKFFPIKQLDDVGLTAGNKPRHKHIRLLSKMFFTLLCLLLFGRTAYAQITAPVSYTWTSNNANSITVGTVTPGVGGLIPEGHLVIINTTNNFIDRTGAFNRTIGLPAANAVYSGSGEQIVYAGAGNSPNVTITGLDSNTPYFINVVGHFTGGSVATEYTANVVVGAATCGHVPDAATGLTLTPGFEQITLNSITDATGSAGYLIKVNTTNSFTDPSAVETSLPLADAAYSGSGEQVVYVGASASPELAITNLISTATTEYFFKVYSFSQNCTDGNFYFETTGFTTNERTCGPPPNGYNEGLFITGGSVGTTQLAPVYNRQNFLVPSGLIVYINAENSFTDPEATFTTLPTENSVYVGSGQQAVEVGGPSSFFATTTNLIPNTTYYYRSYPYFTCGGTSYVNLTDIQEIALTTCNFSDNLASNPVFGNITSSSMELNSFTALSPTAPATAPDGYVIRISDTNSFTSIANGTAVPAGNTVYSGTGEQVIYAGNSTAPNINVTGLSANTTYYFNIVAYYPSCDINGILYQQTGSTFARSNQSGLIDPTITFNDISKTISDPDFTLAASSNSGGTITYQILDQTGTQATTLSGTNNATVTLGTAGTITIQAVQAPSGGFAGGTATSTLTITAPDPTINGDPFLLINSTLDLSTQISSNSAGAFTYSILGADLGASISGNTLTSAGNTGNIIVRASQAATPSFAATDYFVNVLIWDGMNFMFDRAFNLFDATVQQGETIQLQPASDFDDNVVTYSIIAPDPTGSSVDNNTDVFTAGLAGTVTLRASTPASNVYNASSRDVTITIEGTPQTITFNPLANVNLGDAPFNLTATASSGLAVSYVSSNTAVATVSGNTVTIVGEGTTNITASQGGGGAFAPAADVVQSLTVDPIVLIDQTVTASPISGVCEVTSTVSVGSTQQNVNYYLRNSLDNSVIEGPVVGTGAGISFAAETLTANRTYEVFAELGSSSLVMTDQPTVSISQLQDQTVIISQANATSADISLSGSQAGVDYYLRNNSDNALVQGPLAGTGSGVAFTTENINDNTTYNVLAAARGSNDLVRGTMQFDGVDDYISVPVVVDEDGENLFFVTLETWVYLPSSDNTDVNASIITHEEFDGGFGPVVPFYINISGGNIFAGHSDPDDAGVFNTTPVSYPVGEWFHVAASFNRSTIILYINGTQVASVATPSVPNAQFPGNWRIGRNHETTIDPSKVIGGRVADTRIWITARTATQIANSMNTVGSGFDLSVNYQYTATSGTFVQDEVIGFSGNQSGTLINAAGDNTNWGTDVFLTGPCSLQLSNTVTAVTKTEITASDITFNAPANLVFDGTAKTYTVTPNGSLSPALPASDVDLTYEGRNGTIYASSVTAPTDAGDYMVTATVNASNPDYQGSVSQNFTITPAATIISLNLPGTNPVYSGLGQGISASADDIGSNPTLSLVTEYSVSSANAFSTTLPINAGTYDVRVNLASSETNYMATQATGILTIDRAPLTATLSNLSIVYGTLGATNVAATYTGFVNGETAGGELTIGDGWPQAVFTNTAGGSQHFPVGGPHSAAARWAADAENNITSDNYVIAFVPGDLSVTSRPINVTADNRTVTYGEDVNIGNTVNFEVEDGTNNRGLANGESAADFTGEVTFANITAVNAGTYNGVILPTGGLTNSNYSITFVGGNLIIEQAQLTVRAQDISREFGAANPTVTTFEYSGFQNGDGIDGDLDISGLLGSAGSASGIIAVTANASANAGTTHGITVNVSGLSSTNYSFAADNSGLLTINQATATVSLNDLTQTFDGTARSVSATSSPVGLTVDITYDGLTTAPTNAGTYAVVATINETNYQGSASGTLTVNKATATISLGDLTQTFDGTARTVTATTNPSGLTVDFTYDASATAPTNAGTYTVVGTINETNYEGSANGTLTVNKAVATVSLNNLNQTFDGAARTVTATTNPSGLTVEFTYDGLTTAPTNAGTYAVVGTINETNYQGSASGTLTVNKAVATVSLNNLTQTFNGMARTVTATTNPVGLTVDLTYDGLTAAPTNAGSYAIVGTINEVNYEGSASGTLTVNKAAATVSLGNLSQTFDGTARVVTATTDPSGLTVDLTYDGLMAAPTNAGSYAMVGTISDTNYQGSANGTLTVNKATATIIPDDLNATFDGTPQAVTATTMPSGLNVIFTYDGSTNAPVNAGSYALEGTIDDTNYQGSISRTFFIDKAIASVVLGNLTQTFDGTPRVVTATTNPVGLTVDITYDLDPTAPINAGTHPVEAEINDPNYEGSASGTLTVNQASQTITFGALVAVNQGDANFDLTATGGASGNPVTYTSSDPSIASITGNTVTIGGFGMVTITASQAGNANYVAAVDVQQTLVVNALYIWNGTSWNNGTPTVADNARIAGDYTISANGPLSINALEISIGATLTVDNNETLTVNGVLNSEGMLHVTSGASLITYDNVMGTGYQIDRTTTFDVNTGRYSIVGSPVAASGFGVLGASAWVFGYDDAPAYEPGVTDGLNKFRTPTQLGHTQMNVGTGYFSAFTGDATGLVEFAGTPNTGTINVPLQYVDQGIPAEVPFQGFNLVSNPYPSAIEAATFLTANNTANITGSIYLWDDNNSADARGTDADYLVVNLMGNTDSRNNGAAKYDGFIRSGQGFFVKATAATSINFTNSMRTAGNNSDGGFFREEGIQSVKLRLSNGTAGRSTVIGYAPDATRGEDAGYDAQLLGGQYFGFYSLSEEGEGLAIQGLPTGYEREIPLGVMIPEPGEYTISLNTAESNESLTVVFLRDNETGEIVNLREGSYRFRASQTGKDESRFVLQAFPGTVTNIAEDLKNQLYSYTDLGELHVVFKQLQTNPVHVMLYNLDGKVMVNDNSTIENNRWSVSTVRFPAGVYVLRVMTTEGIWTNKMMIE